MRKAKTDKKDALLLADLARLGRAPPTQIASETTLKLQSLSRLRLEFVQQIGGLKNRVLGILDRIFPEYPECCSNGFIRTSRELLKQYPEPELFAEANLSELTAFLNQHSRGRFNRDRAEQIKALAKGTFGIRLALDAFTLVLKLLVDKSSSLKNRSLSWKRQSNRLWKSSGLILRILIAMF